MADSDFRGALLWFEQAIIAYFELDKDRNVRPLSEIETAAWLRGKRMLDDLPPEEAARLTASWNI
jgi:hypothetical protein